MLPIIPKKEPLYNADVALFILLKRIYNTLKQLLSLIALIVALLLDTLRKDLKKKVSLSRFLVLIVMKCMR